MGRKLNERNNNLNVLRKRNKYFLYITPMEPGRPHTFQLLTHVSDSGGGM